MGPRHLPRSGYAPEQSQAAPAGVGVTLHHCARWHCQAAHHDGPHAPGIPSPRHYRSPERTTHLQQQQMTIKQSIRAAFVKALEIIETEGKIRAWGRHSDLLADNLGIFPSVAYIEGPEQHIGSPSEGQDAYRFTA